MEKTTILLVDDDNLIIQVLTNFLAEKNYRILTANNGKNGFAVANKEFPDLIITDWEMPEMDGIELVKALKSIDLTRDIPIIIATGIRLTSSDLYNALDAGASDFIRKPIDRFELVARVKSSLLLSSSFKKIKQQQLEILDQVEQLRKKNEEIEKQSNDLQVLNSTKDKMFSLIGHDLRNSIGNSKAMLEILSSDPNAYGADKLNEVLGMLKSSAINAYDLLENLLFWARAQRNEINYHPEIFDIKDIIDEVVYNFSETAKIKKIRLISNVTVELPVLIDESMIYSILRNFVSNAIRFTNEGGEVILSYEKKPDKLEISVKDTGIGISEENKKNLFNKNDFFATYSTTGEKGIGIGLIVCKQLIEFMNGEISFESNQNKGSIFKFNIPLI